MFEGVRYLTRNDSKTSDAVLSGGILSKEIFPNINISFKKGKYGEWKHLSMHEGSFGVYLATEFDGKPINKKLIITFDKIYPYPKNELDSQ